MYKYVHSSQDQIVYRYPAEPNVLEQKDRNGKRTGWLVDMGVLITRADNCLAGSLWNHAKSAYPQQTFDAHYRHDQVVSYFRMHHAPVGDQITEDEYKVLQAQYESMARRTKRS